MAGGTELGARLGVAITNIATRTREQSLARSTPGIVQLATQVADKMASQRAEVARAQLVSWLEGKGVTVPPDGELSGLLGGLSKVGGWLAQNVIGTAIGFGVGQSLSAVLNPYFTSLVQDAWRSNPVQVLSPAELALAVLRGNLEEGPAAEDAKASGIDLERFRTMIDNTGEPPGLEALLGLWRRGKLTNDELERGIRQSRVRNEWLPTIKELGVQWPSWGEFLDAYLEGQIEEGEARRLFERAGGDPDLFDLLFHTRGQAPTPTQLLDLWNRGIIPEGGTGPEAVSYEQGFLEGPWRNKWLPVFKSLAEYVVPPRSVVPMVRSGAFTLEQGITELAKSGVSAEVGQAMLEEAASGKLATERDLVKADILAAYRDGIMEAGSARSSLEGLGYSSDEADLILAIEDHRWEQSFRSSLVNRLKTLYTSGKIDEDEAQSALAKLGLAGTAASKYLALWDAARETPYAALTEAQVRAAAKAGIVTPAYYGDYLLAHGYNPDEVQILTRLYKIGGEASA